MRKCVISPIKKKKKGHQLGCREMAWVWACERMRVLAWVADTSE